MKKLLVFHPSLAPYRIDFFNELAKSYQTIFYFNYRNVVDQNFNQDVLRTKANFEQRFIDSGFNIAGRAFRFGIIGLVIKHKPDMVFCSEFGQITLIVYLTKKLLNLKFKLYTLSDDSVSYSRNRKGLRSIFRNFISKHIDGVIFPSEIVACWNKENVSSSINTLVMPIIHSDKVFRNELQKCIGPANSIVKINNLDGNKVILFVGRFVKEKNIDFLLKAFTKLDLDNIVLVLVGDGVLLDEMKSYVINRKLDNKVIFTGRLEGYQLYSWFLISNVLVLPSINEAFGVVVNEALLAGSFVLCSELAGATSLICSSNGLVFSPYNESELVNQLKVSLNKESVIKGDISMRDSLMPFTFNQSIKKLIEKL